MPFLIAGTYLSVALCWLLTVLLLRRRGGGLAHGDRSYRILLSILLIDGVRTFAEQAYFGIGHTLEHASPDPTVLMYLHSPLMILVPKLSLLICSLVVLYLVAFRWSPSTEQKRLLEAMNTVRQAEQLRQTQADLMQTIFDQMDQGVMAVEADGTVSAFNQRLLALLELPEALLASRPKFIDLIAYQASRQEFVKTPWEQRPRLTDRLITEEKRVYERERPNGVVMEVRSVPMAGGGMLRTYTDVTVYRRTLAQATETLRLESLGRLTGGIAHDFNNLLAVISLNAELIEAHLEHHADLRELTSVIITATTSGADLTRRLMAYARKQPLAPKLIRPADHVLAQIELVRRAIGGQINVVTDIERDAPMIKVDPSQIGDALLNIAINARDAMPGGGTLTIALHRGVSPQGNPMVVLAVTDTGCGMPPEVMARATDPFFTTKAVGKGTGLGLSVVEGFARQSGGYLNITSAAGEGTTISVALPVADEALELMPPPTALQMPPDDGKQIG
jgi:signal transduction histidine kinase